MQSPFFPEPKRRSGVMGGDRKANFKNTQDKLDIGEKSYFKQV